MAGFNPQHGFDCGLPPPSVPPTQPQPQPQLQYVPVNPAWPQAYQFPQQSYPPGYIVQPNAGYPPGFYPPQAPQFQVPVAKFPGGIQPGYQPFYHQDTCKIHVIKTPTSPWQQQGMLNHAKLTVPCSTTVKELMQGLGCNNSDPKKNKLVEVTEGGNGKWYRGIGISGDEKDKVKKTIAQWGWDASRTGNPGERPVVWLWLTKD